MTHHIYRRYNALYDQMPALLAAWRPGEEGGNAVWSILNGTTNPSGRSAHTWPRTVGQVHQYVPWYLESNTRPPSAIYADYQPASPLVPFGFGLSYSQFTFSHIQVSSPTVAAGGTFAVTLHVSNAGPAGKTVVQVYFGQDLSSRVRFSKMLLGFKKVAIPANAVDVAVTVPLNSKDFEMWSKTTADYIVEPGNYTLYTGQYSTDPATHVQTITVTH